MYAMVMAATPVSEGLGGWLSRCGNRWFDARVQRRHGDVVMSIDDLSERVTNRREELPR